MAETENLKRIETLLTILMIQAQMLLSIETQEILGAEPWFGKRKWKQARDGAERIQNQVFGLVKTFSETRLRESAEEQDELVQELVKSMLASLTKQPMGFKPPK